MAITSVCVCLSDSAFSDRVIYSFIDLLIISSFSEIKVKVKIKN